MIKAILLISLTCFGWYSQADQARRALHAPAKKPVAAQPKVTYRFHNNRYWLKIEQHGTTRVYRGVNPPQWMTNPYYPYPKAKR